MLPGSDAGPRTEQHANLISCYSWARMQARMRVPARMEVPALSRMPILFHAIHMVSKGFSNDILGHGG
eukprot:9262961-Karenia_brevis.AAC.1